MIKGKCWVADDYVMSYNMILQEYWTAPIDPIENSKWVMAGVREEFNREKLLHSLARALHKRPVPAEYIDQAVEVIIAKILAFGEREIDSRNIGELVMHELKKLDKVAYIRFASVYRSFSDVEDFNNAIKDLD